MNPITNIAAPAMSLAERSGLTTVELSRVSGRLTDHTQIICRRATPCQSQRGCDNRDTINRVRLGEVMRWHLLHCCTKAKIGCSGHFYDESSEKIHQCVDLDHRHEPSVVDGREGREGLVDVHVPAKLKPSQSTQANQRKQTR